MTTKPLPLVLLLALVLGAGGKAFCGDRPWEVVAPAVDEVQVGKLFEIRVFLPGVEPGSIADLEAEAGRGLLFESARAARGGDVTGRTGAEIVYRFLALEGGARLVVSVSCSIDGEAFSHGPFPIEVGGGREVAAEARLAAWRAPESVYLYQGFSASLVPSPAGRPSIAPVPGFRMEALSDGSYAFLPLRPGLLELPAVPGGAGSARARVLVHPLPARALSFKAVGSFSSRAGPERLDRLRVGESARAFVEIAGEGSLPLLTLPEPRLEPPGVASARVTRSEGFAASKRGFSGRVSWSVTVLGLAPGKAELAMPGFAWLDPADGTIRELEGKRYAIEVSASAALPDPFASLPPGSGVSELAPVEPGTAAGTDGAQSFAAEARALWEAGKGAGALRAALELERRYPSDPLAAFLPERLLLALGSRPERPRDLSPEPWIAVSAAIASLVLTTLFAALASSRKKARARPRPFPALAIASFCLLVAFCAASAMSVADRARTFAVLDTDEAFAAPSSSSSKFPVKRGSPVIVLGEAGGMALVETMDRRLAWVEAELALRY